MPFDVCPICGHRESTTWTPKNQTMNVYVDAETGAVIGVFNDDADTINPSKKRPLLKQSVFESKKASGKVTVETTKK